MIYFKYERITASNPFNLSVEEYTNTDKVLKS